MTLNANNVNALSILVVLVIVFISTRIIKATAAHVFALIACIYVVSRIQEKTTSEREAFFEDLDYRLAQIGSPPHFYMDVNVINFFYDIYLWRAMNPGNYDAAIAAFDQILAIEENSEERAKAKDTSSICARSYNQARSAATLVMNMLHGMIYNVAKPIETKALTPMLERAMRLVWKHLAHIRDNCEQSRNGDVNVDTVFIDEPGAPDPWNMNNLLESNDPGLNAFTVFF